MNEQSVTHAHCPICATCKGHHLPREDHIAPHQPDYVVIPRRAKSPLTGNRIYLKHWGKPPPSEPEEGRKGP